MKSKILAIISLVSFLTTLPARAEDNSGCGFVDASKELGVVRSQGNMGWCYANTAADLVSYRFRKQWNYHQASAVFIALGYNYKQNSSEPGTYIFTEGGDIRAAASYAREYGYACPRELDNIFVMGGFNLQLKQKLHVAEKLKKLFDISRQSPMASQDYDDFVADLNSKGSIISLLIPKIPDTFPDAITESIARAEALGVQKTKLAKALSLDLNLAVVDIAKSVCEPYRLPMDLPRENIRRVHGDVNQYYDKLQNKIVYQKPDMLKLIDQELTDGNIVGIDYSINLISPNLKDTDSHASVVVGRDMKNGQCLYKIRNSWGPGCVDHWSGTDYHRYNESVKCEEDGHVWVTKTNLKSALSGFVYIDLPERYRN